MNDDIYSAIAEMARKSHPNEISTSLLGLCPYHLVEGKPYFRLEDVPISIEKNAAKHGLKLASPKPAGGGAYHYAFKLANPNVGVNDE